MNTQRHQIQRQIIEITVPNRELGIRLHDELPRIQRNGLEALIDRCCSEVSRPDRVHRLGRVEVNLDLLSFDNFEKELLEKLYPVLREALVVQIREEEALAVMLGEDPATNARLELVSQFARTGTLPFWADMARPHVVNETVEALLERDALALAELVRELSPDVQAVGRLVRQVKPERLRELLEVLVEAPMPGPMERAAEAWELLAIAQAASVPARSIWMAALQTVCRGEHRGQDAVPFFREVMGRVALETGKTYRGLVGRLCEEIRPRQGQAARGFGRVLGELAAEVGENEARSSLRLTPPAPLSNSASLRVEGGAGKTRVPPLHAALRSNAELERGLGGEVRAGKFFMDTPLGAPHDRSGVKHDIANDRGGLKHDIANDRGGLKHDIANERSGVKPDIANERGGLKHDIANDRGGLKHDIANERGELKHDIANERGGVKPDIANERGGLKPAAPHDKVPSLPFGDSPRAHQQGSRDFLTNSQEQPSLAMHMQGQSERGSARTSLCGAAGFNPLRGDDGENTGEPFNDASTPAQSPAKPSHDNRAPAQSPLEPLRNRSAFPQSQLDDSYERSAVAHHSRTVSPRTSRITQHDPNEVYLDTAGLVLLWPFLVTFFDRVELLDHDKRFRHYAARCRAVYLLQYLATSDLEPPEYRLPLTKIICGMSLKNIFDTGPELTEIETTECADLLTAVVTHAKTLGDITHQDFRDAFLLRRGVLSTRDNSWLLRVERTPYDLALDHLPWPINWIRLPWMEAPLAVEWLR